MVKATPTPAQASAQAAHNDPTIRHPRNPDAARSKTEGGSQRTHTSVFDRLGAEVKNETDSTWTPNATRSTRDLRNHLNQQRGGDFARLGLNPAPSYQSASRRTGANPLRSRVSRTSVARTVNSVPAGLAPTHTSRRRDARRSQGN